MKNEERRNFQNLPLNFLKFYSIMYKRINVIKAIKAQRRVDYIPKSYNSI